MLATRRSVLLVVLVVLGLALSVESASAHAFLDRSDPQANDVAGEVPESVRLWFTEPLEVEYSQAELFDVSG